MEGEILMRKFLFALAALAVVGTAVSTVAVAPAAAEHWQYRSNYRYNYWRPSVRYYAPRVYNCYVRRVVPTIFGPRVEWINRCY
jgi:hypothetical protein